MTKIVALLNSNTVRNHGGITSAAETAETPTNSKKMKEQQLQQH